MTIVERLRAAGCVFAEEEAEVLAASAASPAELERLVARRCAGEPLEQVVGWAQFRGLRIEVEPGVFVPRRRTEALVEAAIPDASPGSVVLDLCCGSGAIGAAIADAVPGVELHAADVDPAAVRCARRNIAGPVYEGDLFDALPRGLRGRVDLLVANVPYVPTGEIDHLPAEARLHEPHAALDGGADGLDILRRVANGAPAWLARAGRLFIETSPSQADVAAASFATAGLDPHVLLDEERDTAVVVGEHR